MQFLNQLLVLSQTQIGSVLTLLLIVITLVVRRLLPVDRRFQGSPPLFFLTLALGLGIGATAALKLGAYTVWGILSFLDLLSLIAGVTILLGLFIFDVALARTRVQVPTLIRSLIQICIIALIILTTLYQRGLDPLSLLTTAVVTHMKTALFSTGESLLRAGAVDETLYLIASGEVGVSVVVNNTNPEVLTLQAGDFFCGLSAQNGEASSARYTAKSDTQRFLIDQATLASLFSAYPQIAEDLSSVLAARDMTLNGERQERSAEALAQQSAEMKQRLLTRIQRVFRSAAPNTK